jgi:hypothetical protein
MTTVKFKIFEAGMLAISTPLFFASFHLILGDRPLISEFEAGGVTGVVLLKLIEALRAHVES